MGERLTYLCHFATIVFIERKETLCTEFPGVYFVIQYAKCIEQFDIHTFFWPEKELFYLIIFDMARQTSSIFKTVTQLDEICLKNVNTK